MHRYPISQVHTARTNERFGFFLLGAAMGALAATVVALLYAPQSGEETRELIATRSRQLSRRARSGGDEFIRRVREATDEWADKLQAAADDLVAEGRMTPDEARSQVDDMISRVKSQ
jgi:gas vesicle protein